jgi:hypothetical protein
MYYQQLYFLWKFTNLNALIKGIKNHMIVYFTPKKYDLNVILNKASPARQDGIARQAGLSCARREEFIELIKISSWEDMIRNDNLTKYNINNVLL